MSKQKYQAIWRDPAKQTNGFPKLMVNDNCVTGSINVRNTRLPLWAIISTAINEGWGAVEQGWGPEKHYGYTKEDLAHFLYCLLEQRGEFGRLLLLLASVEKPDYKGDLAWWDIQSARRRVIRQLERCLDTLRRIDEHKEAEHTEGV